MHVGAADHISYAWIHISYADVDLRYKKYMSVWTCRHCWAWFVRLKIYVIHVGCADHISHVWIHIRYVDARQHTPAANLLLGWARVRVNFIQRKYLCRLTYSVDVWIHVGSADHLINELIVCEYMPTLIRVTKIYVGIAEYIHVFISQARVYVNFIWRKYLCWLAYLIKNIFPGRYYMSALLTVIYAGKIYSYMSALLTIQFH